MISLHEFTVKEVCVCVCVNLPQEILFVSMPELRHGRSAYVDLSQEISVVALEKMVFVYCKHWPQPQHWINRIVD